MTFPSDILALPQVYRAILGFPERYLYHPWMGMMLSNELHTAHDRGDWALYPRVSPGKTAKTTFLFTRCVSQQNDYVVHYFSHEHQDRRHLHGKSISFDWFRGNPANRPRRELLLWHHRQCVQMHFRGVAHRMGPVEAMEEITGDLPNNG